MIVIEKKQVEEWPLKKDSCYWCLSGNKAKYLIHLLDPYTHTPYSIAPICPNCFDMLKLSVEGFENMKVEEIERGVGY